MSAIAFIAEAGPAPHVHAPQLIDIDGTLWVQLGLFAVLMIVLTKLLWRPYLRVRAERVNRVEGYRKDATHMEREAADRLTRAEVKLAEARRLASGERVVARAEAHAREQTLLAEAQAEAQRSVAAAGARLDATIVSERARLHSGAQAIAVLTARKILGREVTP